VVNVTQVEPEPCAESLHKSRSSTTGNGHEFKKSEGMYSSLLDTRSLKKAAPKSTENDDINNQRKGEIIVANRNDEDRVIWDS